MKPIQKSHNNLILKAPLNWNADEHGKCEDLHITRIDNIMYSYHKPTWKQRFQILFGRHVRLCVCSDLHPPIALDTEN